MVGGEGQKSQNDWLDRPLAPVRRQDGIKDGCSEADVTTKAEFLGLS